MPKRKANWWPPSILSDPDVLSVDDEGRFVLCKICHVHYAVHGGKKPKPVIMNSNFRTRAWDVHKERTNSHRMQKQQERLQQAKQQSQQQTTGGAPVQQQPPPPQTQTGQAKQQQAQPARSLQPRHQQQPARPQQPEPPQQTGRPNQPMHQPTTHQMPSQRQNMPGQSQTKGQRQSMPALASQAQTLTQGPPRQVQKQAQAPNSLMKTQRQQQQSSPHTPLQSQSESQVLQQQRRLQQSLEETKEAGHEPSQVAVGNSAIERPESAAPQSITAATTSGDSRMPDSGMVNAAGKRPASTAPVGTPAQRRRVFRAGSPGSSMQLVAESEAAKRAAHLEYEQRHSFMVPGSGNPAKKAPSEHDMAMDDSSARWRHMHEDVSRALNSAPRRRQQGPASYTSGEIRAAKTLAAQTETGDLGSNNSERVAKKLRSLNDEYHASNMRHADAYNIRHSDVFDRRSAEYKQYWGTLRDVYTSSGTTSGGSGGSGNAVPHRKSHHRPSSAKVTREESKETEDSTTPDDSGSSEDASFKPAVVVHDAALISAIERLTDVTSKQIANLFDTQASDAKGVLAGVSSVMTDLRVQQGNAFGRIIELQEKHLKVMENILEIKLRKEAARSAKSNSNGSANGSSSGSSPSGSSPGGSTSGSSGLSSQPAESEQCA